MGDPLKAIGALYFVWSGTQALQLVEATESQLMDCFPIGYRGVKSALSALKKNGWLAETPAGWRITGNEAHVIKGKTISEKNRAAAIARWEAERMRNAMHQASGTHTDGNANAMRENARSDPMRSDPIRSDPPEGLPQTRKADMPSLMRAYADGRALRGKPILLLSDRERTILRQLGEDRGTAEACELIGLWLANDEPEVVAEAWPLAWMITDRRLPALVNKLAEMRATARKKAEREAEIARMNARPI